MQSKKISKNIKFSILNYMIVNLLKFIVRMIFVRTLSIEYLGINGLFTNILSMLTLAELGIGPAIVFSLYKPLAYGDKETIKSIMYLFKRVYTLIGGIIALLGLGVYPWIDNFIKNPPNISDLHYFYLAFLLNTSVSYFWSYKRNLLIADQRQYLVNIYQAIVQVGIAGAQIILLYLTHSYWSFVILMIVGTVIENVLIARKADRQYPFLRNNAFVLNQDIKNQIIRNTKAMVIHKTTGMIVFSSANIILSKFVGIVAVGLYSNYFLVINAMNAFAGKFFEAITASIGNMLVVDTESEKINSFKIIEFATSFQAGMISVSLVVLFNPFIELWLGKDYLFDESTVMFIVLLFYLMYMRKAVLMFKDAAGLFWYDRYKAIAEMIFNLCFCIYGTIQYGVIGVVWGSIGSTLLTCFWVEPYILFKYSLPIKLSNYFLDYIKFSITTFLAAVGSYFLYYRVFLENSISSLVFGGILCVFIFNFLWYLMFNQRNEYRYFCDYIKSKIHITTTGR